MSSKVYFCSLKLVCFPLSLYTLVNPNTHLNPSSTAIRFVISERKTASLIIPRKLFFSFCICIGLNHKEVNLNANDVRKHKTHIESRIRFGKTPQLKPQIRLFVFSSKVPGENTNPCFETDNTHTEKKKAKQIWIFSVC